MGDSFFYFLMLVFPCLLAVVIRLSYKIHQYYVPSLLEYRLLKIKQKHCKHNWSFHVRADMAIPPKIIEWRKCEACGLVRYGK